MVFNSIRTALSILFTVISICNASDFPCYSCSFIQTGTTQGIECVTSPWNVTTANKVTCQAPNYCITKEVYLADYSQLRSMDRGCRVKPPNPIGCDTSAQMATCYDFCRGNLCNKKPVGDKGHTTDLAQNLLSTLTSIFASVLLSVIIA